MKTLAFASRNSKEIVRDRLNSCIYEKDDIAIIPKDYEHTKHNAQLVH